MQANTLSSVGNTKVLGEVTPEFAEILSPGALRFVATLARLAGTQRDELLRQRAIRQAHIAGGKMPDFLPDTRGVRSSDWMVDPVPRDLIDRRVEITGPAGDRKMVINALNSGANVFMADFEDANSPTWQNTVGGQVNLRDAARADISYTSPEGKLYTLADSTAVLFARPRGWHLLEKHVLVDGQPCPAGIFDFGLYLFHNARTLLDRGTGPYFYLPKLESHLEARLWNVVFTASEELLALPHGTIKATVLIETILAAFEMDEILFELKDHSAGLNCGRWDYIFSLIKKLRNVPEFLLPDRAQVTMATPCMRSYSLLCIKTCHRRNAHAIGGMSAYIPVKNDPDANQRAFEQVRADKTREVSDGHDGTWVAHPGLVQVARGIFDQFMPSPNQIDRKRDDVVVTQTDLLEVPQGTITELGLRTNIAVGIGYIGAWLRGTGAAPINNLMEDAATAEISRAQVWQWIHHPKGVLIDGRKVTVDLCLELLRDEPLVDKQPAEARDLFLQLISADEFVEFFTLPGYQLLE